MTTQSFAAKCILTGQVHEGDSCSKISTRIDVSDLNACEGYARATKSNKFFGLVEDGHHLVATDYSFKSESKIEETIVHDESAACN